MRNGYRDHLVALTAGDALPPQAYGFPLREAGGFDGLYCIDRPRRQPGTVAQAMAFMFKRYTVIESNATGERFLVARMSVEPASRARLKRYEPEPSVPSATLLRQHLDEPPDPRMRLLWLPEAGAWGMTEVGCASGVVVDRRALGRLVYAVPDAREFLRNHFLLVGADPFDEERAEYAREVELAAQHDPAVASNKAVLLAAFEDIVTPGAAWPRS